MDASPRCIDLIHGSEGFYTKLPNGSYKSYLDKLANPPVWTIYCGLTKGVTGETVWTVDQCEKAFSKEMSFYEDSIERMVTVPLNQNQFDALVSLVYNIGPGNPAAKRAKDKKGFYWSTLRKLINEVKFDKCPEQFKRYIHSGGKVRAGLVTRRAKEAALFMTPMEDVHHLSPEAVPDETNPPMPQQVDVAPPQAVSTTLATSKTVRYSGGGIIATLVSAWSWLFGVAKDAGTQAVSEQQTLTPFSALFKALGANMELIALIVVLGCLAGVIFERLAKERA
jgi:lysozyme